jgi:hypothetical protein
MSYIKTTTGENTITFDAFYQYIWARNYGDVDVYISNHNNIVAGDDDVVLLPAGEAVRLTVNGKTLYVLGSTTLEVHAQNFSDSPFAWNESGEGGGSDVSVVSLSVDDNGTYTAPSGTAYSPVIVTVPTGAEIITRSDWNALTPAQKQAKGLVAIQDASTGFKRGELVNGADYIPTNVYIPYSNEQNVLCEAYVDNFDATANRWGNGDAPVKYMNNTKKPTLDATENAVFATAYTTGAVPYMSVSDNPQNFTVYAVLKANLLPTTYARIISAMAQRKTKNGFILYGNPIIVSHWGDDISSGVSATSDYFVCAISNNSNSVKTYVYAGDSIFTNTATVNAVGTNISVGRTDIDTSDTNAAPADIYIKYLASVAETETDAIIEANIQNLYNEFIAE